MASFQVAHAADVVTVTVDGPLDLDGGLQLLVGVAQDAAVAGKNLLVDIRGVRGHLSFRDVYRLVQTFAEHPTAFGGRIALLDGYNEELEKAQFFEASATEFGFDVRTFLDESAARLWLGLPVDPPQPVPPTKPSTASTSRAQE